MTVDLIHRLVAVRTTRDDDVGDRDEYGQPVDVSTDTTAFRGLVQPKEAREQALLSQAGAIASDHTIFAWPVDIIGADYIAFADPDDETAEDPNDDRRYQVTGIRDAAGIGHHLEIDAVLVTAGGEEEGS
jgi:hypothetical protein